MQEATQPTSSHASPADIENALKFRRRMLQWPNPVEFVNNLYGCHPGDNTDDNAGDDNTDYFTFVYDNDDENKPEPK